MILITFEKAYHQTQEEAHQAGLDILSICDVDKINDMVWIHSISSDTPL